MQEVVVGFLLIVVLVFLIITIVTAYSLSLHDAERLTDPEPQQKVDIHSVKQRLDKWYKKNMKPVINKIKEDFFKPIKELPKLFSSNPKERWQGSESMAEISRGIAEILKEEDTSKRKRKTLELIVTLAFPVLSPVILIANTIVKSKKHKTKELFKEIIKDKISDLSIAFSIFSIMTFVSSFSFSKNQYLNASIVVS